MAEMRSAIDRVQTVRLGASFALSWRWLTPASVLLRAAPMEAWIPVVAALVAGAVSVPHCVAMCGPLAAFAAGGEPGPKRARTVRHQLGRLLAYGTIGAFAGASGGVLSSTIAPDWLSVAVGVVLAVAMSLSAYRLLLPRPMKVPLVRVGKRPRTPWIVRLMSRLPREPFTIGLISAALPCGALYSALLIAGSARTALMGALAMGAFALVSGIGLGAAGWIGSLCARSRVHRYALAALLIIGAMTSVARPLAAAWTTSEASPACLCHAQL